MGGGGGTEAGDGGGGGVGAELGAGAGAGHPQLGHLRSVAGFRCPHSWHLTKATIIYHLFTRRLDGLLYKRKREPVSFIRLRGSGMPVTKMKQNGSRFYDI